MFDEDVLELAMSSVQAWERLHDPEYCSQLSMGDFHDLMLRAGYSTEVIREAANQRGWERLCAGVTI